MVGHVSDPLRRQRIPPSKHSQSFLAGDSAHTLCLSPALLSVGPESVSSKTALGATPSCIDSLAKGWSRVPEHRVGSGFQGMRFLGKSVLM